MNGFTGPELPIARRHAGHAVRAPKGSRVPYKTPERDVVAIIDAPPTPVALLAPGGRFVALVHYESHPPIALLARGYLPLAGIRIDPVLAGRQRVRRLTGLSVLRLADGTQRAVALPDGAQPSVPDVGAGRADLRVHGGRGGRHRRVGGRRRVGDRPAGAGAAGARRARRGPADHRRRGPVDPRRQFPAGARRAGPGARAARGAARAADRGDGGQAVADGDLPGPAAAPPPTRTRSRRWPRRCRCGSSPGPERPRNSGRPGSTSGWPTRRTASTCWCTGCGGRSPSASPTSTSRAAWRCGRPRATWSAWWPSSA